MSYFIIPLFLKYIPFIYRKARSLPKKKKTENLTFSNLVFEHLFKPDKKFTANMVHGMQFTYT